MQAGPTIHLLWYTSGMYTQSPVESVVRPGYVHPAGTEAGLKLHSDGHYRLLELRVYKAPEQEGGDPALDFTEEYLLPVNMAIDTTKPKLIRPPSESKARFVTVNGAITGVEIGGQFFALSDIEVTGM